MNKNRLHVKKINDDKIWYYLSIRNKKINVQNSISKKKINYIDHLNWWFKKKKMQSYLVYKNKEKLFILTENFIKIKKINIVLPGLMTCSSKYTIFDLLWSIRWQKNNINKLNKNSICLISVPKKNFFSNIQTKYFDFKLLTKKNKYYKYIKKIFTTSKDLNFYYRHVSEKI